MDLGLKGRVILITGASSGIGQATAEAFGGEGAYVMVTYRTNAGKAEQIVQTIREAGGDGATAHLDLAEPESIKETIRYTLERWNRIDVLVNNAVDWIPEAGYVGPIEKAPLEEWQGLIRSNLEGTLAAIHGAIPIMREKRWGRIANLSSVAAVDGMPGYAWYAAAKAAIHGLTRTLAKELGPSGILVNTLMPGATLTDRIQASFPERKLEAMAAALPIRRIPAPKDVASVVLFLCSAKNGAITGEIVRASGGRL